MRITAPVREESAPRFCAVERNLLALLASKLAAPRRRFLNVGADKGRAVAVGTVGQGDDEEHPPEKGEKNAWTKW